MEMNILIIRKMEQFNNEIIHFLVNESFTLFCYLKGIQNLSKENSEKLKEALKNMYSFDNKNFILYVAYKEDIIIGCAYITNTGYLRDLFVKKEYQKQGIGSLLLKKIILDTKENESITLSTHPSLAEFYKKNNFIIIEEGENKIKMKR